MTDNFVDIKAQVVAAKGIKFSLIQKKQEIARAFIGYHAQRTLCRPLWIIRRCLC